MKSRAITLGASVIALTLAGASQAQAGVLGNGAPQVPDTGIAPTVEANVKVNLKTNVKVPPVAGSLKASVQAGVRGTEQPRTSIETMHHTGTSESRVLLDANGHGLTASADQRRKGTYQLEATGHAGPHRSASSVSGYVRRAGKASVHARARSAKARHGHTARSVRKVTRAGISPSTFGHDRGPAPLQAIGRAVGNQIGLIHAGWLLVLTVTGCLCIPGLMRRLNRAS
jgi:hypothetical protein